MIKIAFEHSITGATDRSSIVRGDVGLVSGTWAGSAVASGTIETGGSAILCHGLTVGSAGITSGTSKTIFSKKNQNEDGTITVSALDAGEHATGDWWAIARLGI